MKDDRPEGIYITPAYFPPQGELGSQLMLTIEQVSGNGEKASITLVADSRHELIGGIAEAIETEQPQYLEI